MRRPVFAALAGWVLAATPGITLAQQADSNPTWAVVAVLLSTAQRTPENTVRKQVMVTLERMGAPAAQPLAKSMEEEFKAAVEARVSMDADRERKHLDTVVLAATVLGRMGNVIARDDYVTEILLAFTHETKKTFLKEANTANARAPEVPLRVREAAIDALGRIFAQKAVFLVLQSPNELTREKNKEAQSAVEYLRNETQNLKKNIVPLVQNADPEKGRDLLLETRNLQRKVKLFRKVLFIMSELEPPTGKDKDLTTRIHAALADIETNLRTVWAPPGKEAENVLRREAAAKAEEKTNELCEELDDLVRRVDGWLQMNDRTRKVILSFQEVMRSVNQNPPTLLMCAAEALGRVYGSRD